MMYKNGEIYQGQFKNDVREGKGIIYKNNKEIYNGEFKNDMPINFTDNNI